MLLTGLSIFIFVYIYIKKVLLFFLSRIKAYNKNFLDGFLKYIFYIKEKFFGKLYFFYYI